MLIGVAKETWPGEVRSALVPANATKLIKSGFSISMESGAGQAAGFTDQQYTDAGVSIVSSRAEVMAAADIFLAVR
ncbi:MAG TPA: NAD(P)(+) transhydrogenase (Re/Si-specific) subunit alpha, partial [Gammaproteobacteria bacterium]|nr:NAD(P)(+) transhydrogenase (Re/Si-specific) subunit alpha [Gammaproteobacteria bacterium]